MESHGSSVTHILQQLNLSGQKVTYIYWRAQVSEQDEILDGLQRVFRIITGCPREVAEQESRIVARLYGYRPYHNIHHAILVGGRAMALANSEADDEPALFLAAMYHDCIYAPATRTTKDCLQRQQ